MRDFVRNNLAFALRHIPLKGRWRLKSLLVGRPVESKFVVTRIPRVGLMKLDLSSGLEADIYTTGTHGYERAIGDRILEYLQRPKACFVDVGANVGLHTLRVARYLAPKGGKVIAFEPIRANYERLKENLALNNLKNVTIECLGLAETSSAFEVHRDSEKTGNVSLASEGDFIEIVNLVALDDWIKVHNIDSIDVIKLDIEGSELNALRGMEHTISEFKPVLIVEINPMWTRRMQTSTTELIQKLRELDYKLYDCLIPNSVRKSADAIEFVDPNGSTEVNVVAIPSSFSQL